MAAYNEHLESTIHSLNDQVDAAEKEVDGYAAGRGMEQIAERYAELLQKRQDLEIDLKRLEGSVRRR
jgi:hypothetical protein